jgi:hypothetical protein
VFKPTFFPGGLCGLRESHFFFFFFFPHGLSG